METAKAKSFQRNCQLVIVFAGSLYNSSFAYKVCYCECVCSHRLNGNTIMPGDRIIASRIHYYFSEPKRGDIVVFRYPDNEEVLYVKRIIGLPNETVEIKDGNVYINGKLLEEPYIKEKAYGDFGPYEVPEGCYFMLGDNRNGSTDSRRWTNKYVKKKRFLEKLFLNIFLGLRFYGKTNVFKSSDVILSFVYIKAFYNNIELKVESVIILNWN